MLGLVQRLDLGGGVARSEPALPPESASAAVVCSSPAAISASDPRLEGLEEDVRRLDHITLKTPAMWSSGHCARCREA